MDAIVECELSLSYFLLVCWTVLRESRSIGVGIIELSFFGFGADI